MIERHLHWRFLAHNGEAETEQVRWGCRVDVIGYETEADARMAAEGIVHRKSYILESVYECQSCGYQEQTAASLKRLSKNG